MCTPLWTSWACLRSSAFSPCPYSSRVWSTRWMSYLSTNFSRKPKPNVIDFILNLNHSFLVWFNTPQKIIRSMKIRALQEKKITSFSFSVNLFFSIRMFCFFSWYDCSRQVFFLTHLTQLWTTVVNFMLLNIPPESLKKSEATLLTTLTLSLFVATAFWLLYLWDPSMVIEDETFYR